MQLPHGRYFVGGQGGTTAYFLTISGPAKIANTGCFGANPPRAAGITRRSAQRPAGRRKAPGPAAAIVPNRNALGFWSHIAKQHAALRLILLGRLYDRDRHRTGLDIVILHHRVG